jgi:AcrR family transcriptional regulator
MLPDVSDAARAYHSPRRDAQARETRRRVLEAASTLFVERGLGGTTIRAVATQAGVSVATVEQLFGTKAGLLKAAVDAAIAGDDEPVAVLDRAWATAARRAGSAGQVLDLAAEVITAAQGRSAGLVLAVFEAARADPEIDRLAGRLAEQRKVTARWLVDVLAGTGAQPTPDAVDTLWVLMDSAIYERLVRHLGWTPQQYRTWFARSTAQLLVEPPDVQEDPR